MAESLDDGEFWLPPQFLTDDDMFLDKNTNTNNAKDVFVSETDCAKPLFPFEFPYGFGSGSPVESVLGSAEESDEEDYITGLTCKMARSTLEDDFKGNDFTLGYETSKGGFVSGSPQSTLCGAGSGCRCRQGSSNGSPNESAKVSSSPATWDLLYAAAGEVARMRMDEEGRIFNSHNRGILGPPRIPSPVSVPIKNPNPDFGFYQQQQQSLSYQKLQAAQFHQMRHQQMMKQQGSGVWVQTKGGAPLYHQQQAAQQVVQTRGRNSARPSVLSSSAWPPLQQQPQRQNRQGGSGMRALFLGNSGAKRECAGTGVFLPRRAGTPTEPRKKPACSTVLLPARVVQALNLNLDEMGAQQAQFQNHHVNGNFIPDSDNGLGLRHCNVLSHQKRNFRPQEINSNEVRLPHEWTY